MEVKKHWLIGTP